MQAIGTDPSRRRGKFRRLVEDFAATLGRQGASMPTATIERFLADRITVVAVQIGVSEQTVLRDHFPESWGTDMARQALEDRAIDRAQHRLSPDADVPVGLVGRLVAALGQAQLFAAVNGDDTDGVALGDGDRGDRGGEQARVAAAWDNAMPGGPPPYSRMEAANATSGLGLALHAAASGQPPQQTAGLLRVEGSVLLGTHRVLAAFEDKLRRGGWVSCRCPDCPGPGADEVAPQVADQVAADRAALARYAAAPAPPPTDTEPPSLRTRPVPRKTAGRSLPPL